jgi:hypothetical protein
LQNGSVDGIWTAWLYNSCGPSNTAAVIGPAKKISQRFTLIFSRKNALCGYSLEFRALLLLPDSGAQ